MKTPDEFKEEIIENARRLTVGGANLEVIMMYFREKGFDKIDSINAIRVLYKKSMSEAKNIIDHSNAWSDRFYSDMEFRENALRVLRDIAASQDPNLPKIVLEEDSEIS